MVTDLDVDHNTPIIINVETKDIYETIDAGETYKIRASIINVAQENNTKTRYSFLLDKIL